MIAAPSTRARSSWYFSSTPSVSCTDCGSSSLTESAASARHQSIVSATPGALNKSSVAQPVHERDGARLQLGAGLGRARRDDREFHVTFGIADPLIQAAALQRVVNLPRAVRRHHDERRPLRAHRAVLRYRHLEIRQQFKQERFERLVGAIDFIDQQHAPRARVQRIGHQRLQQRALQQELAPVQRIVRRLLARRLRQPQRHDLARVVPLVQRARGVESFVALQPQHRRADEARRRLRQFGLADARFAFEKQRPLHLEGEKERSREFAAGEILLLAQAGERFIDRRGLHEAPDNDERGKRATPAARGPARTRWPARSRARPARGSGARDRLRSRACPR